MRTAAYFGQVWGKIGCDHHVHRVFRALALVVAVSKVVVEDNIHEHVSGGFARRRGGRDVVVADVDFILDGRFPGLQNQE